MPKHRTPFGQNLRTTDPADDDVGRVLRDSQRALLMAIGVGFLMIVIALVWIHYSGWSLSKRWNEPRQLLLTLGAIIVGLSLFRLASMRPRLRFDAQGLTDFRDGNGLIPWEQVTTLRILKSSGHSYLAVGVADRNALAGGKAGFIKSWWRNLGRPDKASPDELILSVSWMELTPIEALELAERYLHNHRLGETPADRE